MKEAGEGKIAAKLKVVARGKEIGVTGRRKEGKKILQQAQSAWVIYAVSVLC